MESTRPTLLKRAGHVLTPLALATPPMPSVEQDAVLALRRLVAVCQESESGLRAASKAVVLPCFRTLLVKLARQRAQVAAELLRELTILDEEEADHSGPIATGARGAWSEVLVAGDEGSLLFACERAEEGTVRVFEETRRRGLPPKLDCLVARSTELFADALNHLRSVRQH